MVQATAAASSEIGAGPRVVYDLIADYHDGHPSILPPEHFTRLDVEEGGRGAGTVIRFGMKVLGRERTARAQITEPEPGRVLAERVLDDRGFVTTFSVDPIDARRCRVTIATTWEARGLGGFFERLFVPHLFRRIYRAELAQLDRVARGR